MGAHSQPYRVGLTGSIASGKSTVARRLKARGIPVIDLDKVGRQVFKPHGEKLPHYFEEVSLVGGRPSTR